MGTRSHLWWGSNLNYLTCRWLTSRETPAERAVTTQIAAQGPIRPVLGEAVPNNTAAADSHSHPGDRLEGFRGAQLSPGFMCLRSFSPARNMVRDPVISAWSQVCLFVKSKGRICFGQDVISGETTLKRTHMEIIGYLSGILRITPQWSTMDKRCFEVISRATLKVNTGVRY